MSAAKREKGRGSRSLLLPPPLPLLLLPRGGGGANATPSLPCHPLGVRDPQVSTEPAKDIQHLLLLPLLLLLLLHKRGLEEVLDSGVVYAVGATKRRRRKERRPGRHVTDRDGRPPQTEALAASPEAGVFSPPWGVVRPRSLPPLWPWWLSSGSVERRAKGPGPQRSTAARVATTSAVVAASDAEQLPSRAAS